MEDKVFSIGYPGIKIDKLKEAIEKITRREMLFVNLIEDKKLIIELGDIISSPVEEIKKTRKYKKQEYTTYNVIDNEEWHSLEEYPDIKISNLGRIIKNGKIAIPKIDKSGYIKFSTKNKAGKTKTIGVHRLVAMCFIKNPFNKPEVDHINTDKKDNRSINLRWVWAVENIIDNDITRKRFLKMPEHYYNEIIRAIQRDKIYSIKNNISINYSETTKKYLHELKISF